MAEVIGQKSKKRYKMTVGDSSRSFSDDEGNTYTEDEINSREGGFDRVGGHERVVSDGGYTYDEGGGVRTKRVVGDTSNSGSTFNQGGLGAAARRNRSKMTSEDQASALDEKPKATPTPRPTPRPRRY